MNIRIIIQFAVFVLFLLGLHRYLVQKAKKCESKECSCPIKDNLREGYLVVGALAFAALCLVFLIELFVQ